MENDKWKLENGKYTLSVLIVHGSFAIFHLSGPNSALTQAQVKTAYSESTSVALRNSANLSPPTLRTTVGRKHERPGHSSGFKLLHSRHRSDLQREDTSRNLLAYRYSGNLDWNWWLVWMGVSHNLGFYRVPLRASASSGLIGKWRLSDNVQCHGFIQLRRSKPHALLISPLFAIRMRLSAARYARAWIVQVGWPRPDVTKLLPSQMKRFATS